VRGPYAHDHSSYRGGAISLHGRTALYRYFAADDSLLYVGISKKPERRQLWHAYAAANTWWPLVVRRTDEWIDTREKAERAEIAAIESEAPRFNVKDNPNVSPDIERLLEVRTQRAATLAPEGSFPLYFKLAIQLLDEIKSGSLPDGSRLPARRDQASRFGVSTETVKRACIELERVGVLRHTPGGYYVKVKTV
jgi:hypothetical protein